MGDTFRLVTLLLALWLAPAEAAEPGAQETVQSDISTREISIQSNFAGIEIVIFGSIDFSHTPSPDEGNYDVITVIRSPDEPLVARRKEHVAGIWVNSAGRTFPGVPGFYAVLATRPFKAIATEDARRVAKRELVRVNAYNKELIREENHVTITEKRKVAPREEVIQLEDRGIFYIPIWCVEGVHGIMIINAGTGKIVSEDYYRL
jgi:uncharacterized protein (TIGR02186 family)